MVPLINWCTIAHNCDQGNILINSRGRACLADFGLSTMTHAGKTTRPFFASTESLVSFTPGGTVRWTSPELLDPINSGDKEGRPTKSSDCYALGMVVYEVFTDIVFSTFPSFE